MKKFIISTVERASYQKLLRRYLQDCDRVVQKHACGDHTVIESEMEEYVKAAYIRLKVSGPCQEIVNEFLENRMIIQHFFVPKINSLVVEELVPNRERLFDIVVHRISLDTGAASRVDLGGYCVRGVRTNTAELIVQNEQSGSSEWQWTLFDLHSGKRRPVYKGGDEFYLSADGNLFFPVDRASQIGLVDLSSGQTLDAKNKRHFSRYATKVKILHVIHFDSEQSCLFVILMKQQALSFASLKNEVCIKLAVAG
jgi:hypothetical protein